MRASLSRATRVGALPPVLGPRPTSRARPSASRSATSSPTLVRVRPVRRAMSARRDRAEVVERAQDQAGVVRPGLRVGRLEGVLDACHAPVLASSDDGPAGLSCHVRGAITPLCPESWQSLSGRMLATRPHFVNTPYKVRLSRRSVAFRRSPGPRPGTTFTSRTQGPVDGPSGIAPGRSRSQSCSIRAQLANGDRRNASMTDGYRPLRSDHERCARSAGRQARPTPSAQRAASNRVSAPTRARTGTVSSRICDVPAPHVHEAASNTRAMVGTRRTAWRCSAWSIPFSNGPCDLPSLFGKCWRST